MLLVAQYSLKDNNLKPSRSRKDNSIIIVNNHKASLGKILETNKIEAKQICLIHFK
jgi:hypothetical protein